VGFATGRGRYTARGDANLGQHDLKEGPPGSIESILAAAAIPNLMLDIRNAKPEDPETAWACESRPMRSIGAVAMEEQFHPSVVRDLYDVLVYLDTTTAAVQLGTPPQ
jgi:erythromycin esterase-like protein